MNVNADFDKWNELKQFLLMGIEYKELPIEQRKAYSLVYDKIVELDEIEKRKNK